MISNKQPDGVYPFAGLTRFNQGEIPDDVWGHGSSMRWWAADQRDQDDADPTDLPDEGLSTLVSQLPRATTTTAGWKNPVTGEWIETGKHNAVINPETSEMIEDDLGTVEQAKENDKDPEEVILGDDALFNIPTDDYAIINPAEFYTPLAEVIRDEGLEDAVFGEFRVTRNGGRVSADVFFDGKHVECPAFDDDRKPVVVGIQIDYDFYGDTAVKFQGVGMDYDCTNSIRQITDPVTVKHSGDIDSRVQWRAKFETILEKLDLKTDQLSQMILEASQETFDITDLPDGFADDYDTLLEALYAYAGLPKYLSKVAAQNCRMEAADPFEPTWWDIHRGATYAISHNANGIVGTGGAVEQYNRIANDMLTNPAEMGDRVVRNYEKDLETKGREEGGGIAQIKTAFESVEEKRDQYERRDREIRSMIETPEA